MDNNLQEYSHKRYNILTGEWALVLPHRAKQPWQGQKDITELTKTEEKLFAEAISVIMKVYDKIFDCAFPYSGRIHQAPTNNKDYSHWYWHMSLYPPLLRSATVKKFMVGYEMFGSPQRDITTEIAAKILKESLT